MGEDGKNVTGRGDFGGVEGVEEKYREVGRADGKMIVGGAEDTEGWEGNRRKENYGKA